MDSEADARRYGPMTEVGNVADWKVFAIKDDGERVPVIYVFEDISIENGKLKLTETHDLTRATHVEVAEGIVSLTDGARLIVEAVY